MLLRLLLRLLLHLFLLILCFPPPVSPLCTWSVLQGVQRQRMGLFDLDGFEKQLQEQHLPLRALREGPRLSL